MLAVAKVAHVVEIVGTAGTEACMDRVATAVAAHLHHEILEVLVPSFHVLEEIFASVEVIVSFDEEMVLFAVVAAAAGEARTAHRGSCPSSACRLSVLLDVLADCPASHHERKSGP